MQNYKQQLVHQRIKSMIEQGGYAERGVISEIKAKRHQRIRIALIALGLIVLSEIPQPFAWSWKGLAHAVVAQR